MLLNNHNLGLNDLNSTRNAQKWAKILKYYNIN